MEIDSVRGTVTSAEKSLFGGMVAVFLLHTLIAYVSAIHLSQWLVFHWFGWIAPLLQISTRIPPNDWYLQHLEIVTTIPAVVLGYLNLTQFLPDLSRRYVLPVRIRSIGMWTWVVPTLVLLYRMLTYHASGSVLYGSSIGVFEYFFDIQKVMPTLTNPLASEPIRVWAQLSVTAPFYAGMAYSLGAATAKSNVLMKLFSFRPSQ